MSPEAMRIKYSRHLEQRLILRRLDHELPATIFEQSRERFIDQETRHLIATAEVQLYNRTREVMVAYVIEEEVVKLLTIHPLKEGQKENRLKSGRWRPL